MDFSFSKEHQMLRRMAREFAEREVLPIAKKVDEEHRVPMEVVKKAAELGLLGVPFPQKYGGMGAGEIGYCIVAEELGKVSSSFATIVGAHIGIGAMAIYLGGTDEQKKKYLTPLARGEKIAAFALTEAGAGSDAAAIKTRAIRDGNYFVLNGTKQFITNGDIADVITVMAVTDPSLGPRGGITAFIVERDYPGVKIGKLEDKMGIRGSSTAEIILEDVRVPKENVLGPFGAGFIVFMQSLDMGRLTLGAACLGGAQTALRMAMEWAAIREQFGEPIAHKQSIQWMIAELATEIEALRSLVYRTAWLVDTGQPFTRYAAMCKMYGSEIASKAVNIALQIYGAMGYTRDFVVELMYRDAKIAEIYEGTNEIQRIVIAESLFRELGVRIRP